MRCLIPGKLTELLWNNNEFYDAVVKRVNVSNFPRNDQWVDEEGFNMVFALAGYSPEDVNISYKNNELILNGQGVPNSLPDEPENDPNGDPLEEYNRKAKIAIHHGIISRGIARRSFKISYTIANCFDCSQANALMRNGLLQVIIPRKEEAVERNIEINRGS